MSILDDIRYAIVDYPGLIPIFPTVGDVLSGQVVEDIKYAVFDYPGVIDVFPTVGETTRYVTEITTSIDRFVGGGILLSPAQPSPGDECGAFDIGCKVGKYLEGVENKALLVIAAIGALWVVTK